MFLKFFFVCVSIILELQEICSDLSYSGAMMCFEFPRATQRPLAATF